MTMTREENYKSNNSSRDYIKPEPEVRLSLHPINFIYEKLRAAPLNIKPSPGLPILPLDALHSLRPI